MTYPLPDRDLIVARVKYLSYDDPELQQLAADITDELERRGIFRRRLDAA